MFFFDETCVALLNSQNLALDDFSVIQHRIYALLIQRKFWPSVAPFGSSPFFIVAQLFILAEDCPWGPNTRVVSNVEKDDGCESVNPLAI